MYSVEDTNSDEETWTHMNSQCYSCLKRFPDGNALAMHRRQTRPSTYIPTSVWGAVDEVAQACIEISGYDNADTIQEDVTSTASADPSEVLVRSDIRQEMPNARDSTTTWDTENIGFTFPELHPASQPKHDYVGSDSYRRSPHSNFEQQRRNDNSIASPRSYKTAHSSWASYRTAPNVPHPGWGTRNVQNIFKDEFSRQRPKAFTASSRSHIKETLRTRPTAKAEYIRHPHRVAAGILAHFYAYDKVRAMTEDHKRLFGDLVFDCIRGPNPPSPAVSHDSESEDDGQIDNGLKYRCEHEANFPPVAAIGSKNTGFTTRKSLEMDGPEAMIEAMLHRLESSDSDVLGLESANHDYLRYLVHELINLYLTGKLRDIETNRGPVFSSEWLTHLHNRGILLDPKDELNWSGRGQHIEFKLEEECDIPLKAKKALGHSATAIVESVQCRRILLARKTVKCNFRMPKEQAVTEVEHLQLVQHSHIVRIVGTYTLRKTLAILLYPVADQNLEEFMDDIVELDRADPNHGKKVMPTFFGCLSGTISHIHSKNVKHMDIKPKNILVRRVGGRQKVYIADFGIARSYKSAAEAFTDTPTSFTRTYAAPEVILQDTRGYPADIFSLGCVFMEMLAVMSSSPASNQRDNLAQIRGIDFQASIEAVLSWYRTFVEGRWAPVDSLLGRAPGDPFLAALPEMLNIVPEKRPLAKDLKRNSMQLCCGTCDDGPEPFEASDTNIV